MNLEIIRDEGPMSRRSNRSLIFALGLVAALLGGACNRERNASIKLTNQALDFFDRGMVPEALVALNEAAVTDKKNDRVLFYRGLIRYQRASQYPEAVKDLQKAIELNGEDYEYHYHLGAVLSRMEQWGAAINAFEKAVEKKADFAESHFRLGQALQEQARFDRAQESFIEAIKRKPRFAAPYNALGNLYLRFEKFPQAIQVFKNGIENNPDEATNYNDLGLVYQLQQRFDEAINQFQAAIKVKPTYTGALFNLGMAYSTNDNGEMAVQYLKLYLARRTSTEDANRVRTAEDTIARIEAQAQAAKTVP